MQYSNENWRMQCLYEDVCSIQMKIRSMQYLIEDCMQYPNENMEYAVFDSSLYAVFK